MTRARAYWRTEPSSKPTHSAECAAMPGTEAWLKIDRAVVKSETDILAIQRQKLRDLAKIGIEYASEECFDKFEKSVGEIHELMPEDKRMFGEMLSTYFADAMPPELADGMLNLRTVKGDEMDDPEISL